MIAESHSASRARPGWLRHVAWGFPLYAALLLTGTHIPQERLGEGAIQFDKVLHFLAYGGLAFLSASWLAWWRVKVGVVATVGVMIFVLATGAVDEWTQPWVGRSCDLWDWIADGVGALVGLTAFAVLNRLERLSNLATNL